MTVFARLTPDKNGFARRCDGWVDDTLFGFVREWMTMPTDTIVDNQPKCSPKDDRHQRHPAPQRSNTDRAQAASMAALTHAALLIHAERPDPSSVLADCPPCLAIRSLSPVAQTSAAPSWSYPRALRAAIARWRPICLHCARVCSFHDMPMLVMDCSCAASLPLRSPSE